jgi:hypothetical protein
MARYVPPVQSKASQITDVIFLVVLCVGALFMPLWLGLAGASKTVPAPVENPTWESLQQNAVQAAQFEKLGYTPETAHDLILARFDYAVTAGGLLLMVVVVVGYFALMLKFSETEYREVIAEKFGEK